MRVLATGPKYWQLFHSLDDVREQFDLEVKQGSDYIGHTVPRADVPYFPTDDEVLVAWYLDQDYSGSAFVLYEHEGTLYEVNGDHCSCYGLEGQWEPEATTWAALAMRRLDKSPEDVALAALIATHV